MASQSTIGSAVREVPGLGRCCSAVVDVAAGDPACVTVSSLILDQPTMHTIQVGPHAHADISSPMRYTAHSCEPNCAITVQLMEGKTSCSPARDGVAGLLGPQSPGKCDCEASLQPLPAAACCRIELTALRNIRAGALMKGRCRSKSAPTLNPHHLHTQHSAFRIDDGHAGELLSFDYCTSEWSTMAAPFKCKCGAAGSRSTIAGFKHLLENDARAAATILPIATPYVQEKAIEQINAMLMTGHDKGAAASARVASDDARALASAVGTLRSCAGHMNCSSSCAAPGAAVLSGA